MTRESPSAEDGRRGRGGRRPSWLVCLAIAYNFGFLALLQFETSELAWEFAFFGFGFSMIVQIVFLFADSFRHIGIVRDDEAARTVWKALVFVLDLVVAARIVCYPLPMGV